MERGLVERAQEGDRDAFASIVHAASGPLYALAHRILPNADRALVNLPH